MNKSILAGIVIALIAAVAVLLISQTQSHTTTVPNMNTLIMTGVCANMPAPLTGLSDNAVTVLKIEDRIVGSGSEAQKGNRVFLNYVGRLADGTLFDTSCGKRPPLDFILGQEQVIKGWDQGVVGMKVGGIRRLIIPSDLGYGQNGLGPIPSNAALVFDVELLDLK